MASKPVLSALVLISLTVYRKMWNKVELSSYQIEITSKILAKPDEVTGEGPD